MLDNAKGYHKEEMALQRLTTNRVTVGFGLALAVLLGVSVNAYLNLLNYRKSADAVEHTLRIQNTLESIISSLKDVETAQRGYLLTNNQDYLKPYQEGLKKINPTVQRLQELTRNNSTQQQRLNTLESQINLKLAELEQTISLQKSNQQEAALQVVRGGEGKQLMDKIRQLVWEMKSQESSLLTQSSAAAQDKAQKTTLVIILGNLLALGLVTLAIFTLHRDATKRRYAEEQLQLLNEDLEQRVSDRTAELETINRVKDEFLSVLSHELRTPLNAILGWAKLLRSGRLDDAKAEQGLEVIERNARSQAQLIEDLLDISRIITGKLRLKVRPIAPISVVEAALDTVRPAAQARGIRIQTVLDSDAGPVSGDPDRLQQVVWNLLSNAIKFTPKGGRVQVRLERINSHVEIIVSDTGQGINPEFLPYIFDRFSQADASTTRVHSGLGLGLAIARNIVELHGGTIHAQSPGEGQGTTFVVNLPLMIVHRPLDTPDRVHSTANREVSLDNAPSLQGINIVVVDDEADTRELMITLLEQYGATVTAVASASEALEKITQLRPDVLISDIGMPEEDGYSLIRRVRSLTTEQGGQTPAIALTAYARTEDRIQALTAGFQTHIAKPIEPAELVAVIRSFVRRDRSS
ncbi:CHASE3 domain-containing protein [Fortiea contorta]|uniref:CHASE3 domain-containing protein n=1 Tax=Fortiea contorta TaxID=1892405 RepID=UPI0003466F54|nr:CHASE3 domain-containing protein [Fortiea contorta]